MHEILTIPSGLFVQRKCDGVHFASNKRSGQALRPILAIEVCQKSAFPLHGFPRAFDGVVKRQIFRADSFVCQRQGSVRARSTMALPSCRGRARRFSARGILRRFGLPCVCRVLRFRISFSFGRKTPEDMLLFGVVLEHGRRGRFLAAAKNIPRYRRFRHCWLPTARGGGFKFAMRVRVA